MDRGCDRRSFLKSSVAASTGLGLAASSSIIARTAAEAAELAARTTKPIPTRPLGKTGRQVTIYGLGGLFTVSMHDRHDQAVEIVNRAIDLGVNYIDTSAWYGTGASELNIGTVMKQRRNQVFLASKSHDYTYDGTMALFEQSLRRLQTDHLDLYQHHLLGGLGRLEQLQQKHSARDAFERLRDEGRIRYIGVTGHSSRVLADALSDYPYDCALITLNAAGAVMDDPEHLDRFFRVAQEKGVGVIAMKVVERGALIERGLSIRQLLPYVLSYPISTAIVGISDVAHLEENVRVASAFEPLSEEEMAAIRAAARAMRSSSHT
jgi:aryl-alcohol dehydrogenase-like predicted oxidoreductase